jgi:hypothetical protein
MDKKKVQDHEKDADKPVEAATDKERPLQTTGKPGKFFLNHLITMSVKLTTLAACAG